MGRKREASASLLGEASGAKGRQNSPCSAINIEASLDHPPTSRLSHPAIPPSDTSLSLVSLHSPSSATSSARVRSSPTWLSQSASEHVCHEARACLLFPAKTPTARPSHGRQRMATVSLTHAAVDPVTMAGRRQPLTNIPNAVNSPFRNAQPNNGKRTRAQAGEQREVVYGQPPAKKQMIEIQDDNVENLDPSRRNGVPAAHDKADEFFSKRSNGPETAFQRKLAAARERKPVPQQRAEPAPKQTADNNLESIRQWKRHYKRQFPQFVFYFESVPEDVRVKTARQFQSLGAREEKFFSKAVTHVITTRPIPSELASTSPDDDARYDVAASKSTQPAALSQHQRTTSLLDANLQRRAQSQATALMHDVDPRRTQVNSHDILSRARALGIKIWALEKVQRVLRTMLETDTGDQPPAQDTRSHVTASKTAPRPGKDADLEQLLRNEKLNGPADRDMTVAAQDMVPLKGAYIYIHDMDEKTKPVMVRDYTKPATKEQGKWPQFRLTPIGRCPFVEDPAHTKKLQQQERETQKANEEAAQRKTRALAEKEANLRRSPRKLVQQPGADLAKPLAPPKQIPAKRQSSAEGMPPLFGSAQQSLRGLPRMIGGEPVASGLQQSNVTSAIRSQAISSAAISSTAAGVNKRVSDSKEVNALKRKVLERGNSTGTNSNYSMPTSYMNDVRAALNDDNNPPPRAAKRKAQETLGVLHEDEEDGRDEVRPAHRRPAPRKRKPVQKEPKPGYCENCRDKFDDFDDVSCDCPFQS